MSTPAHPTTELIPALREEDSSVRTAQRVLIAVVLVTVAGACLLISAPEGVEAGHRAWSPSSVLRIITALMTLHHQYPTPRGVEIKGYIQGLGAAAALLVAVVGWYLRTAPREELPLSREPRRSVPPAGDAGAPAAAPGPEGQAVTAEATAESRERGGLLSAMSVATAGQVALIGLAAWSLASSLWAHWPQAAAGEGLRQIMLAMLAVAIGRGLTRESARRTALGLLIVLGVTAVIGVWYHYERNPEQRLKFPIGNPIFLAACLLPGITLAVTQAAGWFAARSARDAVRPASGATGSGVWLPILAGVCLVALLWAFVLSDSRGPGLGLLVGAVLTAALVLRGRARIGLLSGAVIIACVFWLLKLWPVSWVLSRPDTLRLRQYSWGYAFQLFLKRPDIGHGQGSYPLLAQSLSRQDAAADPLAFPSNLLGHAHNEWLQILAELGAVGFALALTAIGLTLWSAASALRRPMPPLERWTLIGLMAGFISIIVEQFSDVALRMPGLPVIFYTVWGLVWTLSPDPARHATADRRPPGKVVRVGGLLVGIAGALAMMSIATRDWQGALAEVRGFQAERNRQWDEAIAFAATAAEDRLWTEGRLSALYLAIQASANGAQDPIRQLEAMLMRSRRGEKIANLVQLAREDAETFDRHFSSTVGLTQFVLSVIPRYPEVAVTSANVWLLRPHMQELLQEAGVGGLPDLGNPYEHAFRSLLYEFESQPHNAALGLRALSLAPQNFGMRDRFDLLRIPLRAGPMHAAYESALVSLMRDEQFGPQLMEILGPAQEAVDRQPDAWPDPYVPETLRFAAVAFKIRGDFDAAARLAGDAAKAYEPIRERFPLVLASALQEQASYLLLRTPEEPGDAVEAARRALEAWPADRRNTPGYRDLQSDLVTYLVANQQEDAARQMVQEMMGGAARPQDLDRNIGAAYAELAERFEMFPRDSRPLSFEAWIGRALQLAPDWRTTQLLAVRHGLETGQDAAAMQHLAHAERLINDPAQFGSLLQNLMAEFPESAELKAYAQARYEAWVASTQPAPSETADTRPAPEVRIME